MYLDAQEVLGLSGNTDGCLKGDSTINVWHGGGTHKGVAFPCSTSIPAEIVCCLTVLHDGRNAVIVIRDRIFTVYCLLLGLVVTGKLVFGGTLFRV